MFFHDYVFSWWQMGLLKLAMIALGILIGSQWPKAFKKPVVCWTMFIVFIVIAIYLAVVGFSQI